MIDLLKLFICSTFKTPCLIQESRKCLVGLHMSSYSPFYPKFRSHCNEGQSG